MSETRVRPCCLHIFFPFCVFLSVPPPKFSRFSLPLNFISPKYLEVLFPSHTNPGAYSNLPPFRLQSAISIQMVGWDLRSLVDRRRWTEGSIWGFLAVIGRLWEDALEVAVNSSSNLFVAYLQRSWLPLLRPRRISDSRSFSIAYLQRSISSLLSTARFLPYCSISSPGKTSTTSLLLDLISK